MSSKESTVVNKLIDRVFPRMPDFYALIDEQCDMMMKTMDAFVEFMETGDMEKGQEIAHVLEKQGDELKRRNLAALDTAFATPMDREEIYRAIEGVDHVINYAKTTVRGLQALKVAPDRHMLEMANQLRDGAQALQAGFAKIALKPSDAEADAIAVRKAERRVEKAYRNALAELFDAEEHHLRLAQEGGGRPSDVLNCVTEILRRREIYRHLSNASDRLAHAGQTLHDIIVKIA
ncbi:MAG: DUF47 family protein [Paracoccaceae bacterium]|nr:DUF47 family protein [Paracoccaceae bacterium]